MQQHHDFPNTARMVVDAREHCLISALDALGVPHTVSAMPVGDIQIVSASGQSALLFERKTIQDLASSLKDGRLYEQLQRRRAWASEDAIDDETASHPRVLRRRRFVILEGPDVSIIFGQVAEEISGISSNALRTIIVDLATMRDEPFLITTSPSSTAEMLGDILNRFRDDESEDSRLYRPIAQTSSIKLQRRANLDDKSTILCMHLSAVPGISFEKARQVSEQLNVGSIREFIAHVLEDPNANGGSKSKLLSVSGVGKTLALRIHRLFGY